MNQEFKEEWVAALKSGDYKQTRSVLESDNKFCCLGVACDLLVQKDILEVDKAYGNNLYRPNTIDFTDDESELELPLAAQRYMEVDEASPTILVTADLAIKLHSLGLLVGEESIVMTQKDHATTTLAELNDSGHFTFEDIAQLIEEQL